MTRQVPNRRTFSHAGEITSDRHAAAKRRGASRSSPGSPCPFPFPLPLPRRRQPPHRAASPPAQQPLPPVMAAARSPACRARPAPWAAPAPLRPPTRCGPAGDRWPRRHGPPPASAPGPDPGPAPGRARSCPGGRRRLLEQGVCFRRCRHPRALRGAEGAGVAAPVPPPGPWRGR